MSQVIGHSPAEDYIRKREALEELIQSDGWRIFVAHALNEWQGRGYHSRMTLAFDKGDTEPRVLHKASYEILRLIQWPTDQVRDLKGIVDE